MTPSHYVIIGNGVCGITAAFTLRARDKKARITVVSGESDFFFSRTALMYAFMDRMERRQLEPYERKVYAREKIELRRGWVTDLDAHARTLTFADGATLAWDKLLLATGSLGNVPPLPNLSAAKDGVVRFVTLEDLDACERLATSSRSAVVVGGGLIGIELVECLVHHGIETHFVVREDTYWPAALFPEEGEMVGAHLRRHGVHLHLHDEVTRVDVDSAARVSGVVLKSGPALAAQMLGLAVGVSPRVDAFKSVKTAPLVKRGVVVDRAFRTSLPSMFAAGDCAEVDGVVEQLWYAAKRQGVAAAHSMLGDDVAYAPPVFFNSSKFFEIEYTTVGRATPGPGKSLYRRHASKDISQRIIVHDDVVVGFNMLGSRWDHAVLERFIAERRTLAYVGEHLHEAQFDVEFGRVPLSAFAESLKENGT